MSDKKQLPRAGFQLRKKPQQQDDTLIKLYEESELKKKGKAPSRLQILFMSQKKRWTIIVLTFEKN